MTLYRRDSLKNVNLLKDTHAGLWLDKYLESDETGAKDQLVHEVTGIGTPDAYGDFFKRWRKTLEDLCGMENCREARVLGRMAVNLGSEAVLETSIALHRTYGVPYIPGSALKGLASHYVLHYQNKEEWGRDSEAFKTLFGDTTSAGYVTFYDALYVPGTGKGLAPDVITVHHLDYYQGKKPDYLNGQEAPPADWDSPIPIPFITATGRFLIALSGPDEWVKAAFDILTFALEREGIGAKTSSGYGRMSFDLTTSSKGMTTSTVAAPTPAVPPKGAAWKTGKVGNDGKSIQPAAAPEQKLSFQHEHVLPKDYTPAKKADVQYTEETLPNGDKRVWVKKLYYPVD